MKLKFMVMIVILKVILLMMMRTSLLVVMKYLPVVEVVISPDLAVVLTFMKMNVITH